jgi:hypothetical protein
MGDADLYLDAATSHNDDMHSGSSITNSNEIMDYERYYRK